MLQAQNGRQFNLAAKAAISFFAEKGVVVKHSDALNLVARLAGHVNYEAAQASLTGPAKGVAPDVQTWRQLAHAIGTLTDEQLDMPVKLTEGCDSDGNATFTEARELLMANADCVSAGAHIFADNQPVLLVEEFNPVLESDEARRIELQFEVATGESAGMATHEIRRSGIDGAVSALNSEYGINISLGRYVAYSQAENGFWNADFGYVKDRDSATGYSTEQDVRHIGATETLTPILYAEAADCEDPDA